MNKRQQIEKLRKTSIGKFLERYYLSWRFQVESALYNGKSLSKSTQPSIVHFSVNKAATQHTKEVLRALTRSTGIVPVDYNDFAFHTKRPFLDHLSPEEMEAHQHLFKPKGYLYSVFGGFVHGIKDLETYKIILMVRDPRDILVSDYFSIKKSHPEPSKEGDKNEAFLERRNRSRQTTIDEFVISESPQYEKRLKDYLEHLGEKQNVLILRYEDMIADYPVWLSTITDFLEAGPDPSVVSSLVNRNKKIVGNREDQSSHYRKGIQGDFKEKLKPETIEILNFRFRVILNHFGYAD